MRFTRHSRLFKLLVFVCLLAVPLVMTAEATHFHGKASADSCPICAIAHAVTPALVATVQHASPVFSKARHTPTYDPILSPRRLAFELSVRPPPAL